MRQYAQISRSYWGHVERVNPGTERNHRLRQRPFAVPNLWAEAQTGAERRIVFIFGERQHPLLAVPAAAQGPFGLGELTAHPLDFEQ